LNINIITALCAHRPICLAACDWFKPSALVCLPGKAAYKC
jgi:hypothetical protein